MIDHLDHLVITTANLDMCVDFYSRILGMRLEEFADGRLALKFGKQKFNLHVKGREFEPKASVPTPGALDLCLIAAIPLDRVITKLRSFGVPIIEGPVARTGAVCPLRSIYIRDPDGNLVEISEPTAT
ncbi:MAG: lactoylglutathione lyase [Betaproteobacteria bacterium RIFCSPLOWO2_12_FULL_63_13]|nr:MAG: lactoylglutathione lyase [Betaproteobacteria bacterium RIFCSPLOWO2_12_FULL_63_13]